jgi:hypothetical protein
VPARRRLRRLREVSPGRFRILSLTSLVVLFVVVTSGAFVRLTGSASAAFELAPARHAAPASRVPRIRHEFGNRVVAAIGILLTLLTWLAARRTGLLRFGRAGGARRCSARCQIPRRHQRHPRPESLAVMSHFRSRRRRRGSPSSRSRPGARARLCEPVAAMACGSWSPGIACVAVLVVTGAVATASDLIPDARAGRGLGLTIVDTVYCTQIAAAVWDRRVLGRSYCG